MKNDFVKIYSNLLNHYISIISGKDTLGPEEVNIIRFNLRGLIISYLMVARESTSKISEKKNIKEWILTIMGHDNLFLNIIDDCPEFIIDDLIMMAPEPPKNDLGYTYEKLLSIDANSTHALYGNRNRNETGSYFTPMALADLTIEKVLSHFISENSLQSIRLAKVADFTCGSGVFLTEYLKYAANHGANKEIVVGNLYGFDIDPIVLEIAKYNILLELGDLSKYNKISEHFKHCNFLLNKMSGAGKDVRIEAAKKGYIYDEALSIDLTSLPHFDIVLGNPPWEKIRFEEKAIKELYDGYKGEKLCAYIRKSKTDIDSVKTEIKKSEHFEAANNGELNTYALFTKAAMNQLQSKGCLGLIVKSSLMTSQVYSKFFRDIREKFVAIVDFVNTQKIFDIDGRERFSIICISESKNKEAIIGMNIRSINEADSKSGVIDLTECDIINPLTGTLPNVRSINEFRKLVETHKKSCYFFNEYKVKYGRLVHLTNHRDFIIKEAKSGYLPIYEGKFIAQYNANYSGFNHIPINKRYTSKATSAPLTNEEISIGIHPESRYYISDDKWKELSHAYTSDYMLAWHSLTSATNSTTCVATILPFIPTCQSIQFLMTNNEEDLLYLTGLFNSSVFEYILKRKLNGIDLTRTIIDQMPVPSKLDKSKIEISGERYSAKATITNAVAFLLKDDDRLTKLVKRNIHEEIFRQIHDRDTALLLIDEAIALQYHISGEDLIKIKEVLA